MIATPYLVRPLAAGGSPLTFAQAARAYQFPTTRADGRALTGAGQKVAIVELGGAFSSADFEQFCAQTGITPPSVTVTRVNGATITPDPGGANVEVMLDVEAVAAVAPGADIELIFADNTDDGFLAAFEAALASGACVVSCSWGGPGSSWPPARMQRFDAVFARALAAGILVCCAAGDAGMNDGTSGPVADFPCSSPHVIACGGTRLILDSAGGRLSETVWDDGASSATGGGVSSVFPAPPWQAALGLTMRAVPDVAGNADPVTGFEIVADGQPAVAGGTSGIAPVYAGLIALLAELGVTPDQFAVFASVLYGHPVCTDITSGGAGDVYPPSTGYDESSGMGVVIGTALAAALTGTPAPTPSPTPAPVPPPAPVPTPTPPPANDADAVLWQHVHTWAHETHFGESAAVARALRVWASARGYHRAAA